MSLAISHLDIKKAFDTISHDYIWKVLDAYGFGPQFQQWLKLLYKDIDAKVIVHGHTTQSFPIERGVRQGCYLSPLLYVLCVEPLANVIQNDPLIKGTFLPGGGQVKLCQFADDITGFLADTFSVRRFLKIVDTFGNASGAKLNKDKCSGIWLGRFARNATLHNYADLKWELNAKILVIYAGIDDTENANWSTFIARIAKQLDSISQPELTLKGKVVMLNTKIFSQLLYKATILDVPKIILGRLHKMINSFIRANKMVLIKRDVLELSFNRGGVNLVNVPIKVKTFQIKHILDFIYGSTSAEWKAFGRYWLGIRLKNIEQVKSKLDWIGPFAETPNEFYQKCYEQFKLFLNILRKLTDPIDLAVITTKQIYDLLRKTPIVIPKAHETYTNIDFSKIYKPFNKLAMNAFDLDLEYKIIHRAINVKPKLKRLHITNNYHCNLCNQHAETFEHIFVQCYQLQEAKSNLEEILKDQINIKLDIQNSLPWVYPNDLTKTQINLFRMACVNFHNAIWKHRNEVTFQNKAYNPTIIKSIFKPKMIKLIQANKYQIE